jgi:hypothetical protein
MLAASASATFAKGTAMGFVDTLKDLREKLGGRVRRDPDKVRRDETDSAAAPIATNPPDLISASEADIDRAGFPPELR